MVQLIPNNQEHIVTFYRYDRLMKNTSAVAPNLTHPLDLIPQILTAIIGGLIIFTVLLIAVIVGFNISFTGKIYPGVSVAGVDLSGMEPAEAASLLEKNLFFPSQGKLLFRDGEKIWLTTPSQVGFFLDHQSTANMAYRYGRNGGPSARLIEQFKSWYLGTSLSPMYVFDENIAHLYLERIASQTDVNKVEASLSVEGLEVVADRLVELRLLSLFGAHVPLGSGGRPAGTQAEEVKKARLHAYWAVV